jgi:3-deoxy-D-manno-octulosonic acid kinase
MNAAPVLTDVGGFRMGLVRSISATEGAAILKLLDQPCNGAESALSGRRSAHHSELLGFGRVVVKRYHRGGVLGRFIRDIYIRWGKTRSQAEFELLDSVRSLGVSAPEPIAYAYRGRFFYRAWLVTREVSEHESLAQLSSTDEELARELTEQLADQIALLVQAGIYHIDLHPGNVLVDDNKKLFIIDFDKAVEYQGRKNDLRDSYLVRWRRAVIKHGLPEFLSEIMSACLRRNFA